MDMAARIYHPNMLQFIRATQKRQMVIITELKPASLRRAATKQLLPSPKMASSIALDMARALNSFIAISAVPMSSSSFCPTAAGEPKSQTVAPQSTSGYLQIHWPSEETS